jgi:predicted O-methyltransferase YrrM
VVASGLSRSEELIRRGLVVAAPFMKATVLNLVAKDRLRRVRETAAVWTFTADGSLEERALLELFPGIERVRASASASTAHHFELPLGERAVIDVLIRHLRPKVLFEFGTYSGTTTALMAEASADDAVVHTIELPSAREEIIGRAFRDRPELTDKIVQHRVDLKDFDFNPFVATVDFVFIDASHERDDVMADSQHALRLLTPGGVIVWDDYQAAQPGVVAALNALSIDIQMFSIAGSRLVVHRRL